MSCTCDFGRGLAVCHCAGCCRTFTGEESFTRHQVVDEEGRTICRDPEDVQTLKGKPVFAVYRRTPDGQPVYGRYRPDLQGRGSWVPADAPA